MTKTRERLIAIPEALSRIPPTQREFTVQVSISQSLQKPFPNLSVFQARVSWVPWEQTPSISPTSKSFSWRWRAVLVPQPVLSLPHYRIVQGVVQQRIDRQLFLPLVRVPHQRILAQGHLLHRLLVLVQLGREVKVSTRCCRIFSTACLQKNDREVRELDRRAMALGLGVRVIRVLKRRRVHRNEMSDIVCLVLWSSFMNNFHG